jgi:CRISPR-associated protein Cas1
LGFPDLAVQRYIYKTIRKPLEKAFEEESIGFRRGLSREKALELIGSAVGAGFRHAVRTDIDDCFPSVDLDVLDKLFGLYLPSADTAMLALLKKCARAGYMLDGKLREREKGLAQGAPLSPLFLNLYLDSLDEMIKASGARLIRYADDILILTKTSKEAEEILAGASGRLKELGLRFGEDKTRIVPVDDGFDFLGYSFIGGEASTGQDQMRKQYKKPLYVTSAFNFITMNGAAVEISRGGKTTDLVPLHRISEIIVMEKAAVSTSLIRKAAETGVPITMTLGDGYNVATILPDSKKHLRIAATHAIKHGALTYAETLAIAREFAQGKLENYAAMLDLKRDSALEEVADAVRADSARMGEAESVEALRGLEGAAARRIYRGLNLVVTDKRFHLHKRGRKKPDMINSLLNFGFYLLFSRINATVRAAGLNPYLGFLHSPADDYESLVCDIQELFRAEIHNFIIKLINLRVIGAGDFEDRGEDGLRLCGEGRVKFLNQFEDLMERKHAAGKPCLKNNIYAQVSTIRSWVVDGGSLIFYRWKQ